MLSSEQIALRDRAVDVWDRRQAAKTAGMPFSEETVTEMFLLDLKISYPGQIVIVPFNKRQEGKIGADWEWCFTDKAEQNFLPMLVQAKILDDKEIGYSHIDRNIGNSGVKQIDKLLETAAKRSVPALYAFYNHLTDPSRIPQACQTWDSCDAWGVSIATAECVKSLQKDYSFESIARRSRPLHCLLCNRGAPISPTMGSSALIARAFLEEFGFGVEIAGGDPRFWTPRTQRPAYYDTARWLSDEITEPVGRQEVVEKLASQNPDIDGVVIFKDAGTADIRR